MRNTIKTKSKDKAHGQMEQNHLKTIDLFGPSAVEVFGRLGTIHVC